MPKFLRVCLFGFLLSALVASTGCIEVERTITLNKDLSGKARFRLTMNMEFMARMVAQMTNGGTPPTDAEIAAATKQMSEGASKQAAIDPKTQIGPLPPGFTLIDATQKLDGLKMTVSVTVGFDDIRKLPTLKVADPAPSGGGDKDLQPFDDLEVKDDGKTILITAKLVTTGDSKMMAPKAEPGATVDPAAAQSITDALNEIMGEMGGDEAIKKQFEAMMKEMKETFRVDSPMSIVETNATKRETGAAIWEYSMQALFDAKTKSPAATNPVMTIRLKR